MNAQRLQGTRDPLLEQAVVRYLDRAGCPELAGKIRVVWSRRLVSTAGMACYSRKAVLLNPSLAGIGAREVDRTLRHELAHFIANYRAGKKRIQPHGPEWKQACADIGIAGEPRCHTLPLPRRRQTRRSPQPRWKTLVLNFGRRLAGKKAKR